MGLLLDELEFELGLSLDAVLEVSLAAVQLVYLLVKLFHLLQLLAQLLLLKLRARLLSHQFFVATRQLDVQRLHLVNQTGVSTLVSA